MKHLIVLLQIFCLFYNIKAQITIIPVFGETPIAENTWYVTKNGDSIQLDNIRFYLSDIQFEMNDKTLVKDSQTAHLINVAEPNSLKINSLKTNFKDIKSLHFNLGIDSLTNVSGAHGGDLDPQKGMYWAWQSGYINMKIEGKSPQCLNRKNIFQFHIGGYLQPLYSIKHVELPIFADSSEGVILKMDVSKFFDAIQIATQNSIMIPCKEAIQLADAGTKMFSIVKNEK
jgi:hypothetical protein